MSYRIDTFENAVKAIEYLEQLYCKQFSMDSYPIPKPDYNVCNLGELRRYCGNILGALKTKEFYIDLQTMSMFEATYFLVWNCMEGKPGCKELPPVVASNFEEAYAIAKKAWSVISALGHDIEIINPPRLSKNANVSSAVVSNNSTIISDDLIRIFGRGSLLADYNKLADDYNNHQENVTAMHLSMAYSLITRFDILNREITGKENPNRDITLPSAATESPDVYKTKVLNQLHAYLVEFRQLLEQLAREIK